MSCLGHAVSKAQLRDCVKQVVYYEHIAYDLPDLIVVRLLIKPYLQGLSYQLLDSIQPGINFFILNEQFLSIVIFSLGNSKDYLFIVGPSEPFVITFSQKIQQYVAKALNVTSPSLIVPKMPKVMSKVQSPLETSVFVFFDMTSHLHPLK